MSLKWRIALGMAAIAALVSIFGATAAYLNTQDRLQSSLDESLLGKARDIARAGPRRPGDGGRPGPDTSGSDDVCPRADFLQPATIAQFISADGDAETCLGATLPTDASAIRAARASGSPHLT